MAKVTDIDLDDTKAEDQPFNALAFKKVSTDNVFNVEDQSLWLLVTEFSIDRKKVPGVGKYLTKNFGTGLYFLASISSVVLDLRPTEEIEFDNYINLRRKLNTKDIKDKETEKKTSVSVNKKISNDDLDMEEMVGYTKVSLDSLTVDKLRLIIQDEFSNELDYTETELKKFKKPKLVKSILIAQKEKNIE